MLKLKNILLICVLPILLSSCIDEPLAHVYISERNDGFNIDDNYYSELTLKNDGDVPAYFVIVYADALRGGLRIDYKEREFGDIFPGGTLTQRITFDLKNTVPDSIYFEISWNNGKLNAIGITE